MKTWFASYYSSFHAEPVEATVLAVEDHITIGFRGGDGTNQTMRWEMKDLAATVEHSEQATKVVNTRAGSGKLVIESRQATEFIQQTQAELQKPWYKKEKTRERGRHLMIFGGIAATLIAAYFLLVPWLSEKFASAISVKTEAEFGDAVYQALDVTARRDEQASMLVNEFFHEMKVETAYNIRVTVVDGDVVNAFALPGGHIVIYTALLKKLQSYPELAALLSHEFVHVNNRHSTKAVFRQLGSRVFISLLFGRFGAVTSTLVDQAERFKSLKYSRSLEKEADREGLSVLMQRKIDTEGFVKLFGHLKVPGQASALPEFLASHPDIDSRINYIRAASGDKQSQEHSGLKTIFEKIKHLQ